MAAYGDWATNSRSEVIGCMQFVEYRPLFTALNNAKRISFSVKAERDNMREVLINLPKFEISRRRRAPAGRFVCVSSGSAAELFDKLCATLDMSERSMDRESTMLAPSKYSALDDGKVSWMKLTAKLINMLNAEPSTTVVYGIYNQQTFEDYYGLTWVVPQQQQQNQE